jgi:hypothetical protein
MSIKLDLKPTELANKAALKKQFKKVRTYYDKFFIDLTDLDDDDDLESNNKLQKENKSGDINNDITESSNKINEKNDESESNPTEDKKESK